MTVVIPFLQIEPTTRCNFTCGFCAGRSMAQQDMDFAGFENLLRSVSGLQHVELQGEGEPLLHPRFFDMVALVNEMHPAARVSFITNGSLFTALNVSRLLALRVDRIYVSMESADPATFQQIRGGKLAKVEAGLHRFMTAKKAHGGQSPSIGLTVTILKGTADGLQEIAGFYQRLGLDGGIMLQPLQAMPVYVERYTAAMRAEIPRRAELEKVRQLITTDQDLPALLKLNDAGNGFYQELWRSVAGKGRSCAWLENGLYAAADGTACSCCFIKDSNHYGLGSFETEDLEAVLALRSALKLSLAAGAIPTQCQGCGIARAFIAQSPAS